MGIVPAWSGKFWQHDEFGFISVHGDDQGVYKPPDSCWKFVRCYVSEEEDAHVFLYRQVSEDCLCRNNLQGLNA